jgi:hypothetical protein
MGLPETTLGFQLVSSPCFREHLALVQMSAEAGAMIRHAEGRMIYEVLRRKFGFGPNIHRSRGYA